jgi:hypothetical protein
LAVTTGAGRARWLIPATLALSVVGPVVAETLWMPRFGYFWQGRYTMPFAVGAVLLAGLAIANARPVAGVLERALFTIVGFLATAHILAYLAAARRFAVGTDGPLNFLSGAHWSPPVPLPLVVCLALGATLALHRWIITLGGTPTVAEDPAQALTS